MIFDDGVFLIYLQLCCKLLEIFGLLFIVVVIMVQLIISFSKLLSFFFGFFKLFFHFFNHFGFIYFSFLSLFLHEFLVVNYIATILALSFLAFFKESLLFISTLLNKHTHLSFKFILQLVNLCFIQVDVVGFRLVKFVSFFV